VLAKSFLSLIFVISLSHLTHAQQVVADAQVKAVVLSDIDKAERITFAHANLRINLKNDTELEYALLHVRKAKTAEDVHKIFQAARDNVDELLDRETTVALFNAGAALFGGGGATHIIDGGNWLTKHVDENGDKKISFSKIPKAYSSTILLGGIQNANSEVRRAIAEDISSHIGKNFEETVDAVTQNRILENRDYRNSVTSFIDREIYDQQINGIKTGLADVQTTLKDQLAGQKKQALKQSAAEELATQTEHLKAGVYWTGLVLGPVVGSEAARKISTIGDNLIQMNTALKQFGPGGLTPDKLLMFTNFATAGFAIAGMLIASQQKDPTMIALEQIAQQLEEIKKQLKVIEGKIDDLSNLVLVGFERALTSLQQLNNQLVTFENDVRNDVLDRTVTEAIHTYVQYASSDLQHYWLAWISEGANKSWCSPTGARPVRVRPQRAAR
jgi:hypothetical protein